MRVDARHPAYSSAYSLWSTCRDAFGGGESVKAAGEPYLPRLGGQDDTQYDACKSRSLFYNATARTVRGLQGLIFRRDPKMLVPDSASPLLDDITLTGVQFDSFCSTSLRSCSSLDGAPAAIVRAPGPPTGWPSWYFRLVASRRRRSERVVVVRLNGQVFQAKSQSA